jgi:FkbH-like protein
MPMDPLEYLKLAARYPAQRPEQFGAKLKINFITNFTDDILKNMLVGAALCENIYPTIQSAPYKQYALELKNTRGELYVSAPDVTFIFFDVNPYKKSEFLLSRAHFEETVEDIRRYAEMAPGVIILNTFILSYRGAYANHFERNPFYRLVREYNEMLERLAKEIPSLHICDTNRIVHAMGEENVRDMRWLHASDIPFTHKFMARLAEEWVAYAGILIGKSKKCIVLDLDNTLWGGVVGETGPLGVALGPDYPGVAFVNFQHALLDFHDRGVLLAIASKNNSDDVAEVFKKNPHMVLKEKHFSAIRTDWKTKPDMIREIAEELNIGVDSMVFLDDDPLNREMVRTELPGVAVPEFSLPPEEYTPLLYSLNLFHQLSLTEEDLAKGQMYAEERQRKKIFSKAKDTSEYIAELGLRIVVAINDENIVPRLSQLTLKTNQFNLTTRRYSESDIKKFIDNGAMIVSGNVSDKFGDYGTVIMAIVIPDNHDPRKAALDTMLMSCRVMGRGVECAFMDHLIRALYKRGITSVTAEFIPTKKNVPAKNFLAEHGFSTVGKREEALRYSLDVVSYIKIGCSLMQAAIKITAS